MQLESTHEVEESLEKYGVFASRTRGTSMWPLFRTHRDTVYIAKAQGTLKKHDVALYRVGNSYVMHRVIRVRENEYLIRGDHTYLIEHVPHDRVLGVLMEFDRKGRHGTVNDLSYRIYTALWCALYPLRFLAVKLWRLLRRIFSGRTRKK